jgi:hypothetical protein
MRSIVSLAALIAAGMLPAAAHADWALSTAAQSSYDGNIGNAEHYADKVGDEILGATLSAYQALPLSSGLLLTAGGDLSGAWFDHLAGLRNVSVDGSLALRKKWGLGAFAPWVRMSVSVGRSEFDASYRDFTTSRSSLAAGKRLGDRWNIWAEYSFEHRAAAPGAIVIPGISADVFTQNAQSLAVSTEYSIVSRLYLDLGLFVRRGDVISTSRPDPEILAAARAVEHDPALGMDAYAYRILGNTYGMRPALSFGVSEHSLLKLAYLRARVYAQGANYVKSVTELAWSYRF